MTAVAGSAEVRKGRLFLVPMPLGDVSPAGALPPATVSVIVGLGHFVAESARTARRFLTQLPLSAPVQSLVIEELNEHTPPAAVHALLAPLLAGHDVGLVSEAGCPVVADPGSNLVRAAHAAGIPVTPLVGPSAPLLALMASGLGGQAFRFAGYLPQDAPARRTAILERQKEARQGVTQIFIETPYRNEALLNALLDTCDPDMLVSVAADLTLPSETVLTRSVIDWRDASRPDLDRRPAVFVLGTAREVSAAGRSPRRRRP